MTDSLIITPEFRADGLAVAVKVEGTAELRRASSSCCGAKLNPGARPGAFTCRGCGQPCDRVLSDPEEVTFNNG